MRDAWRSGLLVLLLAACSTSGDTREAASTAGGSTEAPPPEPTAERPLALQSLLPSDFDGVPAHTFATAPDMLVRLAALAGVDPAAVEAAYASEHGATFVQMYAIRVEGRAAEELLTLLPAAAYPGVAPEQVEVARQTLAGRGVTVIREPTAVERIGTFYALTSESVLIAVQALDVGVAEAAIAALP